MARIIVPKHSVRMYKEIPSLLKAHFPDLLPMKIKSYSHYYYGTYKQGNTMLIPVFQKENGKISIKSFI